MADFEGPSIDERFRRLLAKANPVRWGFFHHPATSTYCRDRVVLLGDSAHASLPFQAAGAAQGVEDALILSSLLSEVSALQDSNFTTDIVRAALESYDAVRRPRAQKQLEQSAEMASMLFFLHDTGDDMEAILSRLQGDRFDWLWFHDIEADVESAISRFHQRIVANTADTALTS